MCQDEYGKFALKIKDLRISKNLSKNQLSYLVGCDLSYIGKIERCEKYPNLKMIFKLAKALNVHIKDLFDF